MYVCVFVYDVYIYMYLRMYICTFMYVCVYLCDILCSHSRTLLSRGKPFLVVWYKEET